MNPVSTLDPMHMQTSNVTGVASPSLRETKAVKVAMNVPQMPTRARSMGIRLGQSQCPVIDQANNGRVSIVGLTAYQMETPWPMLNRMAKTESRPTKRENQDAMLMRVTPMIYSLN